MELLYAILITIGFGAVLMIAAYGFAWSLIECIKEPDDGTIWTQNPLDLKNLFKKE
jgi:hypothetical protein